jgi:hypothetical protein
MKYNKVRKEAQNLNKEKQRIYTKLAKIDQNWHYYVIFEYPYVVSENTHILSDF